MTESARMIVRKQIGFWTIMMQKTGLDTTAHLARDGKGINTRIHENNRRETQTP